MKTTILSKVLIVLLCSVSFITTHAQGLSLSFNLSETDTLANMIAESKKYDITELTLSGVINIPNANYIRNLNKNGKLKSLNMGNVIGLHGAVMKRAYGYKSYKNPQNETLDQYDDNAIIANTIGRYLYAVTDYNWYVSVEITDSLHDDYFIRSYRFDFGGGWDYSFYNKDIKYEYSEKWPKDVFRDCSFDKFVMPHNLTVIGGADCSFCPQKAEVIVIGNNKMIHAPNSRSRVRVENLSGHWRSRLKQIRRVVSSSDKAAVEKTISKATKAVNATNTNTSSSKYTTGNWKITVSSNVRAKATASSKKLSRLKKGSVVTVKSIKYGRWAKISFKGKTGWVSLRGAHAVRA